MAKARYKTKQMTELHTFLQSVQGQHVTVQEIREYFKDREIAVGTTTIYRQLEKMVWLRNMWQKVQTVPALSTQERVRHLIMRAAIIASVKNVEN